MPKQDWKKKFYTFDGLATYIAKFTSSEIENIIEEAKKEERERIVQEVKDRLYSEKEIANRELEGIFPPPSIGVLSFNQPEVKVRPLQFVRFTKIEAIIKLLETK